MNRNKDFRRECDRHSKPSDIKRHCMRAFLVGGAIAFFGEILANIFLFYGIDERSSYLYVTLFFIILSSVATSLGFFDNIAVKAGAGTLVPVTGFSNAVTSSAIDTKSEGFISGVGTKIFTVAGPVILYASFAGTIYGLAYYFYTLFI